MPGNTGTMERLGGGAAGGEPAPGLVLLCAKDIASVPQVFAIRGDEVIVGREPPRGGCPIAQSSVSGRHARIVRGGGGWRIEDLSSRNGTYVDGRRVNDGVGLRDGAEVRIGDTLFKFVTDPIGDYLPYSLDGTLPLPSERLSSAVPELVGGMQMDRVAAEVATAAPTDLSVLVLGETGTGKEVIARALHQLRKRPGPFCAINCAAIPTNLFESELFGFRKAAFTGADRDRPGLLRGAQGGTVLLDEIGEMPLEAQAKLLRVVETREVPSLGSVRGEPIDVRFLCATNQDLPALVQAGRFREDLFARITAFTITLPPLRDRKEDIYQLVRHFLRRANRPELELTFGFMLALCDYDWPRNVRELEATVGRAVALAETPALHVRHLPQALGERMVDYGTREGGRDPGAAPGRGIPRRDELQSLLTRHAGNVAAVARELGKDRAQVHRLIRRYALAPDEYRPRRG